MKDTKTRFTLFPCCHIKNLFYSVWQMNRKILVKKKFFSWKIKSFFLKILKTFITCFLKWKKDLLKHLFTILHIKKIILPKKRFHSVSLMNKKICRKKVVFFPLSFSNKKKSLHPKHMKKVILLNSPLKNPENVFTPFLAWKNSAEKNP